MPNPATQMPHKALPITPDLDNNGYLLDPTSWNRQIAIQLANRESLDKLTIQHWGVIGFVRNHYLKVGAPPLMRHVCRRLELSRLDAYRLFDGCQQLWRIAGLPNPGEEARALIF